MPGSFKTEAIVLRSIRFGEADRIVHLYTAARGRMSAIAKGSRRAKSRFGGRLEPFFRLDLLLHEGRGDLATVTGASTVDGYPELRSNAARIGAGARACDAVLRLLDGEEANRPAYHLLCSYLGLLDGPDGDAIAQPRFALAFRAKLALAAGFAPELAACARCGEAARSPRRRRPGRRRCARPSARSRRRSSTTPTCSFGLRPSPGGLGGTSARSSGAASLAARAS
jgi:DNA repair protein RecO (recombination protein O)